MEFIISQILASIALVLFILSYFFKKKYQLLFIQLCAAGFNAVSFIVLGSFVGGALSFVSLFRTFVFFVLEKRGVTIHSIFMPVLFGLYTGLTIALWSGWIDIIPLISVVFSTAALSFKNITMLKITTILSLLTFSVYAAWVGNYVSLAELLIESVFIVVSMIVDKTRKIKQKQIEQIKKD